uniref:Prestalk a differentiation protein a n=1 Tax=Tetraselmis sp. GSL018 TaxID=582737 RepID=A0A061QI91_9CHLO
MPDRLSETVPLDTSAIRSTLLLTFADGPEGYSLATSLLTVKELRQKVGVIVAAVSSIDSQAAQDLKRLGAQVRALTPLGTALFRGVDWAFLLAPLTSDRLERGLELMQTAAAARVPNVLLLSVVGAENWNSTGTTGSLQDYWLLENYLKSAWEDKAVVLRTYFYQQNLGFWASDVIKTQGLIRLPLLEGRFFSPLHQLDVARAAAVVAQHRRVNSQHAGKTFNLTGPDLFDGGLLAATASEAVGRQLAYEKIGLGVCTEILRESGQLDGSEARLLLGLLELHPKLCASGGLVCPSPDVADITGGPATPAAAYFREHKAEFGRHLLPSRTVS